MIGFVSWAAAHLASLLRFFCYLLCHRSVMLLPCSNFLRTIDLICIYSSSVMTGSIANVVFLCGLVFVVKKMHMRVKAVTLSNLISIDDGNDAKNRRRKRALPWMLLCSPEARYRNSKTDLLIRFLITYDIRQYMHMIIGRAPHLQYSSACNSYRHLFKHELCFAFNGPPPPHTHTNEKLFWF
jgi:hypothetical protein